MYFSKGKTYNNDRITNTGQFSVPKALVLGLSKDGPCGIVVNSELLKPPYLGLNPGSATVKLCGLG